jgi:Histone methylation protein DOT1
MLDTIVPTMVRRPSGISSYSSSPHHVLHLAKLVLRAAAAAKNHSVLGQEHSSTLVLLASSFEELTSAIDVTNPPLTLLPRVPKAFVPTWEQEQRLQRIQNRAALSRMNSIIPEQATTEQQQQQPLELANRTYGTTPAATINTLLEVIYPSNSSSSSRTSSAGTGTFVDAGSGMGLPTLVAALSNRFARSRGIEYERKWHSQATNLQQAYEKEELADESKDAACQLEYICGDMTIPAGYFENGTCIFLNCVTFNADLCQKVGERLDVDTTSVIQRMAVANANGGEEEEEDVFVVSMSRRLPLPSFDLVDVLSLDANEGMFTFYVNRKTRSSATSASSSSFRHHATTDSKSMRMLRETSSILEDLVNLATRMESRVGLSFLAALAVSEPKVRKMALQKSLWPCLEQSLNQYTCLPTKALGSMVLRAMVNHPIGRREVSKRQALVEYILAVVRREDEHPAVRANLLDILSNLLLDSPLQLVSTELGIVLGELLHAETTKSCGGGAPGNNILEALTETIAMKRWWEGHQRVLPGAPIAF